MYPSFIILLVSVTGISFLVWHKMYELNKGKTILPAQIIEKADAVIVEKVHFRLVEWRKRAFFALIHSLLVVRKTTKYLSLIALHRLQAKISQTINWLKGKGEKRASKGSVSFFLKHIAEYKEEMQGRVR